MCKRWRRWWWWWWRKASPLRCSERRCIGQQRGEIGSTHWGVMDYFAISIVLLTRRVASIGRRHTTTENYPFLLQCGCVQRLTSTRSRAIHSADRWVRCQRHLTLSVTYPPCEGVVGVRLPTRSEGSWFARSPENEIRFGVNLNLHIPLLVAKFARVGHRTSARGRNVPAKG